MMPHWWASDSAPESYLENLVSIAITSARQANDASREAHARWRKTRRRARVFAVLGVLSVMVAIVDLVGHSALIVDGIISARSGGDHTATAQPPGTTIRFSRLVPTEWPFGAAHPPEVVPDQPAASDDRHVATAAAVRKIPALKSLPALEPKRARESTVQPFLASLSPRQTYVVQHARYWPVSPW
jgi:hypothetical protein